MSEKSTEKNKSLRDLIYFPIAYNIVGLLIVCTLYAVSPEHFVEPEILNAALYSGVVITHWSLFYIIMRRIGLSRIKSLIKPKKKFAWLPSILVFVTLNVLFTTYMVLALEYGRIPPWGNPDLLQLVFYIVVNPITAGFVEELIWRGYLIEKLLAMNKTEWKAIIYSSVSFAFIHGFFVPDKLAVTFLFGLIAGAYYVRERNLLVLMVSHVAVDVIAFALSMFRPF